MKRLTGFWLSICIWLLGATTIFGQATELPPFEPLPFEPEPRTPAQDSSASREPDSPATRESLPASERPARFNWRYQRTSEADLLIPEPGMPVTVQFKHRDPSFTDLEVRAYSDLLNAIQEQQFKLRANSDDVTFSEADAANRWEQAFYRFEQARRQAWKNGKLSLNDEFPELPNPFGPAGNAPTQIRRQKPAIETYSLLKDMSVYPDDYIGRPVVLYGNYRFDGQIQIPDPALTRSENGIIVLNRGRLRSLVSSDLIAMVDTLGYRGPNNQSQINPTWPGEKGTEVPVLIKGWFIKLWGRQPLIVTESVRILTPRPLEQLIVEYSPNGTSIREDEEWLYYETLRQLQLTDAKPQAALAQAVQQMRIHELMKELTEKAEAEKTLLATDLKQLRITEDQYRTGERRLNRQLQSRIARYKRYLTDESAFPTYVDLYNHWDKWRGSLVTLRGHVRRVITTPGDEAMFQGAPLHELWLFTDDSQHHPAVIVTASLPKDFPVNAEVIDRVTVTGCFYKMYTYPASTDRRAAPLLLAGHVDWSPVDSQIIELANAGHLSRESSLYLAAARRASGNWSETGVMLFGFLMILIMMTVWGRVQRDRRERARILERVDSSRNFGETSVEVLTFPVYDNSSDRIHDRIHG
ncbi:MAG: hypothetical protein JNL58_06465 [Planctomyces sp.]|nr:hypothetical protein [Planctomyces sp.]